MVSGLARVALGLNLAGWAVAESVVTYSYIGLSDEAFWSGFVGSATATNDDVTTYIATCTDRKKCPGGVDYISNTIMVGPSTWATIDMYGDESYGCSLTGSPKATTAVCDWTLSVGDKIDQSEHFKVPAETLAWGIYNQRLTLVDDTATTGTSEPTSGQGAATAGTATQTTQTTQTTTNAARATAAPVMLAAGVAAGVAFG